MHTFKSFASDNYAGIHPEVLQAINHANIDHVRSYGDDPYTKEAIAKFKQQFGEEIDVYFVFNGTAANVLGIKAVTKSHHAIICAESSHLHVDECGALEQNTGCKLLTLPTPDGKLTVELIQQHLTRFGDRHASQPKVISITQSTELGTVYTPAEIRSIADLAHQHGLLLHMDGSRLANAAASLKTSLRALTFDIGVDLLSFGGTKNGLMIGEAVIFSRQDLAPDFPYVQKQGLQLGSKMRFIAAQFCALLSNDLWLQNAQHANRMAQLLAQKVNAFPQVTITQKVEANTVLATLPRHIIHRLQERFPFYIWTEETNEVRWMTAFDTTEEDIEQFIDEFQNLCKGVIHP